MKTIVKYSAAIIILLFTLDGFGQDSCKVLLSNISDVYVGGCKNGLAHGDGIARGIDEYEGQFKKGLPHGVGTYKWKNGDIYKGKWRKGMKHGKGVFSFGNEGQLQVMSGIWKNDEYIGKEKTIPYTQGHIMNLERFSVNRLGDGNKVMLLFYYMGKTGQLPDDLIFRMESGMSKQQGHSVGYEDVIFPAKILITYSVPDKLGRGLMIPIRFEITINEPGNWEIKHYN